MRVCVVGVGNIGLNLLLSLRRAGIDAVGQEISPRRIADLASQHVDRVYASPSDVGGIDAWLLTTSTGPDLSHLMAAVSAISPRKGALVSVESTLPMGTMAKLAEHFEARGYMVGTDLFLVHVPHRILFGVESSVFDAARVIGGVTPACRHHGEAFYQPLIARLLPVEDVRVAEMAKIVENSLRFVEVAFAEELYRYCRDRQIDFQRLREAVNSKGNVRLLDVDYGIGGECLPKDIRFLHSELPSPLLEGAIAADEGYRAMLRDAAAGAQRVLVDGITYKPGYPDVKMSMAVELARALQAEGKQVCVHDPLLTPEIVAELGLTWGEPNQAYDVRYSRPLNIIRAEDAGHGEDPCHGE